jgi:cytochrome c553/mono/diheme cytochrome c family protein
MRNLAVAAALLFSTSLPALAAEVADQAAAVEFFEKRVRPILAERCLACHEDLASGGLRLDSREALLKGGSHGPAVVPGDPDGSLLIQSVRHTHARIKMPMGGEKLRGEEIRDLAAWVKMGAPWPEADSTPAPKPAGGDFVVTSEHRAHWSFQPCHEPTLPGVGDTSWPKNPIDNFVLSRLEKEGLKPVRAADRRTLIRRAYFDLIGLPPTPQEIEAFERDDSPDAFARVVNKLLNSPHYGERWGRHWLDVARYGEDDIRGTSQESYPNAWRYRDWVIQAFNEDMPYDLFIKAQIAGDLLPGVDNSKYVAGLGFLGLGPWYYDIAEPPQARADERDDRIDAITRGILGLTVSCARCHDHKYDPVSMRDYYSLAGVFASSQYREYPLAPEEVVAAYKQHQKKIKDAEKALAEFEKSQSQQLGEILARQSARYLVGTWKVLKRSVPVETVASEEKLDAETLQRWLKYLATPEKEHPYLAAFEAFLQREGTREEAERLATEFQSALLAILAEKSAIDEENRIIKAQATPKRDPNMMKSLPNGFESYDEYCPGCLVALVPIAREKFVLWRDLLAEESKGDNPYERQGGILYFTGKQVERFMAPVWKEHLALLRADLQMLKDSAPPAYPFLHGIAEARRISDLRLHLRGNPYNLGEEVPRRFVEVLSDGEPPRFEKGSGRLELAEAIASHPLAARVMVNRVWHHHFGRGLVRTTSNFGRLGDRPSHPELLEYLTARFMASGYSLKALHREIMLSATYQLSSDDSRENLARDPDNRLLWRANRRRLDVEAIRDSLLLAAGKLDLTLGGPSAALDANNFRRTIYGKVSRFQLDRLLALFDFPSPSASAELRNVTNVPIQWLFFMNSDFVWNQAEHFAERLRANGAANDRERIAQAYRILFGREPTAEEVRLGQEFLSDAPPSGEASPWTLYAQALLSSNEFLFLD